MQIIPPSAEILNHPNGAEMLKAIERAGRTCYKSEDKITDDSAAAFVRRILKRGHESVIEHATLSAKIICDRGVTHEIVRHRLASYSQESTRYCNYAKDKFGNELTFIRPFFWNENSDKYALWHRTMQSIEDTYLQMLELGATPEEARSILPNSLKTEIIVTMNLRAWRHFFKLRTDAASHPQMREVARPLLEACKECVPVVFADITYACPTK